MRAGSAKSDSPEQGFRFILASGSAVRRRILRAAGYSFRVQRPPEGAEPSPKPGEKAGAYARRAARQKALAVSALNPSAIVLGADQVVEFGGRILRKVGTRKAAASRLLGFSGKSHFLVGAWCLACKGEILCSGLDRVRVLMHELGRAEVLAYLEREDPLGSVACYFLEGRGIRLVAGIHGDYFAALGLPVTAVGRALRGLA